MKRIFGIVLSVLLGAGIAVANTSADSVAAPLRPAMSSFMIELGGASVLDTYLSPMCYSGNTIRVDYERMKAMKFSPDCWVAQIETGADYAYTLNPAQTRLFHTVMFDFKWGMMHRWRPAPGLQLYAGGSTQFRGGAIYAPSNSNNVVSVKTNINLALSGMAAYTLKLGKMPVTLRYQATLPLVSAFYSLDYGESYFEMYEGNYSGLAHFGWPGNNFMMTNLVTADMHLGRTVLRLGYRNVAETSWVNNLNTQIFRNTFVIGVGGEWLNARSVSAGLEKARIISAIY